MACWTKHPDREALTVIVNFPSEFQWTRSLNTPVSTQQKEVKCVGIMALGQGGDYYSKSPRRL